MLDETRRIREIRIAEEECFWHKGLEEGIEQGIEERTVEIATKMLNEGLSFDMISKFTGLSTSQIQSLQSNQLS